MRDLGRRKLRTTLTILGITIGIWALVVFGSMANKINALVDGGSTYYEGKVSVSDGSGSAGGFAVVPMSLAVADQIRTIDGVAVVMPDVTMLIDAQGAGMSMGIPPMIAGSVAGADEGRETFPLHSPRAGPAPGDEGST
jgi:ABC-type antimicrobial peptide transport system permease subunit